MVVDNSRVQADSQPRPVGLVWGFAAICRKFMFSKWTECTCDMTTAVLFCCLARIIVIAAPEAAVATEAGDGRSNEDVWCRSTSEGDETATGQQRSWAVENDCGSETGKDRQTRTRTSPTACYDGRQAVSTFQYFVCHYSCNFFLNYFNCSDDKHFSVNKYGFGSFLVQCFVLILF